MITFRDVTFTYPGGGRPVLNRLSLEIGAGEFCAVLGGNGSGKTSFCRATTGLIPHSFRGAYSGEIEIAGRQVATTTVADLARHVGYVYQDFENQLIRPRVRDDVAFAPLNYGFPDFRERADRALALLGLEQLGDRIIWELSGGERHLVAIAGAMALAPDVLVIDEPISQLDPVYARIVYDKLRELNRGGTTIVVVEHFTEFVGEYCSSVALLVDGAARWVREPADALSRVDELVEAGLAPPPVTRIAHTLGLPEPLPVTVEGLAERLAAVPRAAAPVPTDAGDGRPSVERDETPLVALSGFGHHYLTMSGSRHRVLADIDLTIGSGERVALVGGNGSGKSTILRLIAGFTRPRSGTVRVLGHDTRSVGVDRLSQWVSLVYQQPHEMFVEDSIRGDVALFPREHRRPDVDQTVDRLLAEFDLVDLADRDGRLLSGGQMRRASLAIAAGMRPRLLLLDEPTSSLDVVNRRLIVEMLDRLDDTVETTIIATHDMELVARWAKRVIVLFGGAVTADLPARAFFSDDELLERCRIREPQTVALSRRLGLAPIALTTDEVSVRLGGGKEQLWTSFANG